MNGMMFTDVGGTDFEWKKRPKPLNGSRKFERDVERVEPLRSRR